MPDTPPLEDVALPGQDRTPQDYAIEHAEYLAVAAEQFIESCNALNFACEMEDAEMTEACRQDEVEARCALRLLIGEFRKRRAYAIAERHADRSTRPAVAEGGGWISVADRLPEAKTEVLIAFAEQAIPSTGQYAGSPHDQNGWCYPSENRWTGVDGADPTITHWRELPAAPGSAAAAPAAQAPAPVVQVLEAVVQWSHRLDDEAQHITEWQVYDLSTELRKIVGLDGPVVQAETLAAAAPAVPVGAETGGSKHTR